MLKRQPPVVAQNYFAQARNAEAEQRRYFRQLEAEGWVETSPGHWTHPKLPGQEVSI